MICVIPYSILMLPYAYLECGNGKVFKFTNRYQNYHFGCGVQHFHRISLLLMSYLIIVQQRRMNIYKS